MNIEDITDDYGGEGTAVYSAADGMRFYFVEVTDHISVSEELGGVPIKDKEKTKQISDEILKYIRRSL